MPTWDTPNSEHTFTVPDGAESAEVTVSGAGGGDGSQNNSTEPPGTGANGGYVTGTVSLTPGETYTIYVGAAGEDGNGDTPGSGGNSPWYNGGSGGGSGDIYGDTGVGGGGGGATAIVAPDGTVIAAAGGGGGGGGPSDRNVGGGGGGGGARGGPGGWGGYSDYTDGKDGEDGGGSGAGGAGGDGADGEDGNHLPGHDGSPGGAVHNSLSNVTTTTGGGNAGAGSVSIDLDFAASVSIGGRDALTISWAGGPGNVDHYQVEVQDGEETTWGVAETVDGNNNSVTNDPATTSAYIQYRVIPQDADFNNLTDPAYTDDLKIDPTDLTAEGATNSSVSLSWSGVSRSNSYEVQRSEDGGSSWSVVTDTTGTTYTDAGLENGEQYDHRVRANYSGTDSQFTGSVTQTTGLPAPTIDSVSADSREVTVGYSVPDNSSDGELAIERSRDGGASWTTATTIQARNWSDSYTDAGLLDGEMYTYRLTRSTDHETAQSGTAAATTPLPAPAGLSADEIGKRSVTISWAATHNYGETRVEYRRSSNSAWTTAATIDHETEQQTISGLLNGEEYDIRVVAATEHITTEGT